MSLRALGLFLLLAACAPGVASELPGDEPDAGNADADAGLLDAGLLDAGLLDAGAADAGAADAGAADAGAADAGAIDAGAIDAGAIDAGAIDAGAEPALATLLFQPLDAGLLNPERGFYDVIDLTDGTPSDSVRTAGMTLALAGVRLDAFRTAPLSATLLTDLESGLGRARTAGIKVILRFQYNDGPIGAADASHAQILSHLAQLQPLLARNADVIAVMQAGFIGAWGEWHSSTNGLDTTAEHTAVLTGILRALPTSRMVQVRTPHFVDAMFPGGALPASAAYSGTDAARTGHHNDCFLADATDFGTYQSPVETWKSYVAASGRFTPVGGETCAVDPPRSECASATAEMERLHFAFVNSLYHPDVLASWTTGGCMEQVRRRLGYRLVLESLGHSVAVRPGGVLALRLQLRNEGYGSLFNPRPLQVVLERGATRLVAPVTTVDARRWEPGPHALDLRLRLPASLGAGAYRLSLALPDADPVLATRAVYAVQFANVGTWDAATGLNVLVPQLSVDPGAGGLVDPTAVAFEVLP